MRDKRSVCCSTGSTDMSKEPYVNQNSTTYIKRALHISKEPYIHQNRPTKETCVRDKRSMCRSTGSTDISKEVHEYQNSPTYIERALHISQQTYKRDLCT